jgi:beta-galactosidase/beta-glucuronidase
MSTEQPRPEHPRPHFVRHKWLNLNGEWEFAFDFGQSGVERGWGENPPRDHLIRVPFCPESRLSGIEHKDFLPAVWYHRTFEIPDAWRDDRISLNFGAVDYDCRVWINGRLVGRHYGGSASFGFDITSALQNGTNSLVVCATDDVRSFNQPAGKQSQTFANEGCCKYTRVTGIWQTVWLEARPTHHLENVRVVPDLDNGCLFVTPTINGARRGITFSAALLTADGVQIARAGSAGVSGIPCQVPIPEPRPWSPADPYLYGLIFELREGDRVIDRVSSYAGLRKFHIEGNKLFLNNEPVFLRFVLDQGFYPDGVWTAPTDAELKADIERAQAVGFNGARLHEKAFEERFHYWADRLGYLTWAEFPDWGTAFGQPQALLNVQREWRELVLRDASHPSILAWTPLNETASRARPAPDTHRSFLDDIAELTRALDPTRPVNDASGYVHINTDLFTIHDYDQDQKSFALRYQALNADHPETAFIGYERQAPDLSAPYEGQPYIVDEYGGTYWLPEYADAAPKGNDRENWGYGKTADDVLDLIQALSKVLTSHPQIAGFTYTQLTDVEQEVNGIYTYDRRLKFDAQRLRAIFGAPAAIEH